VQNQGRKDWKTRRARELCGSEEERGESSLKEPSRSTWEDLRFLEVDSLDIVGQTSLGLILVKSRNTALLEACVR
jgi:hypothetical protein